MNKPTDGELADNAQELLECFLDEIKLLMYLGNSASERTVELLAKLGIDVDDIPNI
jgi:hypothetical protein